MGWIKLKKSNSFGAGLVLLMLVSACTDGAVSDLLGTDDGKKEDFSALDDGIKTKFTKLETINPKEVMTLKAEFFTFKSSDSLSLTNLLPVTFLPSDIGVETIAEGDLKFTHGFVAKFKLINAIACGKLILSDLKVILCPGSINVAFAADQNIQLSLGSSADDMIEVSALAKKNSGEFSQLESEIDAALDKDEMSEAESGKVAGEDVLIEVAAEPTPTPAPTPISSTLGAKPKRHNLSQVSILRSANESSSVHQVKFAKNYIVMAHQVVIPAVEPQPGRTTQHVRIYDKNFLNGFTLLKEYDLLQPLANLKALGVSSDGSQIYLGGSITSAMGAGVAMVQLTYNRTQNVVSDEKSNVIAGNQMGVYGASLRESVIHKAKIDPQIQGSEKHVRFAGSGLPASGNDSRLFFTEGEIRTDPTRVTISVTPDRPFLDITSIWLRDVLLNSAGEPDRYFVEYSTAPQYDTKYGIISYNLGSAQFEVNYDKDVLDELPPVDPYAGGGTMSAHRFDESSVFFTFTKSSQNQDFIGVARLHDTQGILWNYAIEKPNHIAAVYDMDYDAFDSRNLVLTLEDPSTRTLYLMGVTFTY